MFKIVTWKKNKVEVKNLEVKDFLFKSDVMMIIDGKRSFGFRKTKLNFLRISSFFDY